MNEIRNIRRREGGKEGENERERRREIETERVYISLCVSLCPMPRSLSFIFILSGMAFFLLMVCYLLIDVYKVWSGAPFYFAGKYVHA